jgi:ribosomal protein L4
MDVTGVVTACKPWLCYISAPEHDDGLVQGCVLEPKTRVIQAALDTWGIPTGSHTLMVVDEITDALRLSSRNIPILQLAEASGLNVYDILRADNIVIEAAALAYIQVLLSSPQSPPRSQVGRCPCLG